MMPSHGRKCMNCDNFQRIGDSDRGECHVGPPETAFVVIPSVLLMGSSQGPNRVEKRNFFPEVEDGDWCWEWEEAGKDDGPDDDIYGGT